MARGMMGPWNLLVLSIVKLSDKLRSNQVHMIKQHCKNSKEFSELIRTHTIEEDEIMVSLDVKALYTNVPIDDALAIIKELLENDEIFPDWTLLSPKTY